MKNKWFKLFNSKIIPKRTVIIIDDPYVESKTKEEAEDQRKKMEVWLNETFKTRLSSKVKG